MQIEIAAFLQQLDALLQNNQLEQARAYLEQTLQQAKQEQDFSALPMRFVLPESIRNPCSCIRK